MCTKKNCKAINGVHRYLDTQDSTLMSNLRWHVEHCWGKEALKLAQTLRTREDVRKKVFENILKDTPLTAHFEHKKGGTMMYMHHNHTRAETRTDLVK